MEEATSEINPELKKQFIPEPLPFVDKNGFSHAFMAILWVIIAFVAFNVVGAVVGLVGAFATAPDITDAQAIIESVAENVNLLFWANTSGQVLVMLLGTLLIVKLSSVKGKRNDFLRLKLSSNVWQVTGIAVLLTVAVFPTVTFLGWLNSFVPAPAFMVEMQESMMELITKFLQSDNALILGILHIGIVPAVCEEVMYRGYVQRSLEKSSGIWMAIIVSGFIFGAYHLQVTNILPLSFLGIMLAYLTYISDSLIPAIVAHFVNNGGQVIASSFYPAMLEETITPETEMPWGLIVISIIVSSALVYILYRLKPEAKA
ncbi:MAG: lysostaphin resistance A-like protein [Balneolaceae bacterium]